MKTTYFLILAASLAVVAVVLYFVFQRSKEPEFSVTPSPEEFPRVDGHTVSLQRGDIFVYPAMRYSICNMRKFYPTESIPAAQSGRYHLRRAYDKDIAELRFMPIAPPSDHPLVNTDDAGSISVLEALNRVSTDGFIVLHRGRIVYEYYDGYLTPHGNHALMSLTKSFVGTIGATLLEHGVFNPNDKVREYIPELSDSAFGDATIRNLLDMQTSLDYSEDYNDPEAEVWDFSAAATPGKHGTAGSFRDYLAKVKKAKGQEHGEQFQYKTINTDALAWVICSLMDKSMPQLISEIIWQPMGAHHDAYMQVDGRGVAFAGGGMSANLRDLAAFGEMLRCGGHFNGKQVLPKAVVDDIMNGGNPGEFDSESYPNLPGWDYRNMWWVTNNRHGAYTARGVFGQCIYIDPTAEMVIVRLASFPVAANSANDIYSLPMYAAIAEYFTGK